MKTIASLAPITSASFAPGECPLSPTERYDPSNMVSLTGGFLLLLPRAHNSDFSPLLAKADPIQGVDGSNLYLGFKPEYSGCESCGIVTQVAKRS